MPSLSWSRFSVWIELRFIIAVEHPRPPAVPRVFACQRSVAHSLAPSLAEGGLPPHCRCPPPRGPENIGQQPADAGGGGHSVQAKAGKQKPRKHNPHADMPHRGAEPDTRFTTADIQVTYAMVGAGLGYTVTNAINSSPPPPPKSRPRAARPRRWTST